jgi:hypothetical protein
MKIELLRNCAHGSEIATYLAMDGSGGKRIIKAATTSGGIINLHNEETGWRWYQSLRYNSNEPICRIIQQRDMYLQIQINYIDGKKPIYQNGLKGNADVIKKIVEHYCVVWPYSSGPLPMHGDFSLDNIIVNPAGIHIIDWEHFTIDVAPWGFDILYLLFESLYFGMRNRNRPTVEEVQIIRESIETIDEHHQLQPEIRKTPLRFIKGFILSNLHLWGEQIASFQMKLPAVAFSPDQIAIIDEMICSGVA